MLLGNQKQVVYQEGFAAAVELVLLPSASKVRGKNNEFGLVRVEKAVLHPFSHFRENYSFSLGGVVFSVDPSSDLQIDFTL